MIKSCKTKVGVGKVSEGIQRYKLPVTKEISLFRSSAHFLIGLFVFLILSSMSCLYILEINPLSIASFANIFSHSEGCLFILFMVSFAVQKLK